MGGRNRAKQGGSSSRLKQVEGGREEDDGTLYGWRRINHKERDVKVMKEKE